jgi:hypothetical protein
MRQYYFFRRKGIYYAELVTEAGYRLPAKSTKTRNRDEAAMIVGDWIKNGLPTGVKYTQAGGDQGQLHCCQAGTVGEGTDFGGVQAGSKGVEGSSNSNI